MLENFELDNLGSYFLTRYQKINLLKHQVSKLKKRNFKQKDYLEVISFEGAKDIIDKIDSKIKIIVHSHQLREKIYYYCKHKYKTKTITENGIYYDIDSTIFYHRKCKSAKPYNCLKWIQIDDYTSTICTNCDDQIDSDSVTDEYNLSAIHNVMFIEKIFGIEHMNFGKINDPLSLNWNPNSDHGECDDSKCNYCDELICSKCEIGTIDDDGLLISRDEINGFCYR